MLLSLLSLWLVSIPARAADGGVVKTLVGKATAANAELRVGSRVNVGDVIATGPKGQMRIVLEEGVALQVGPDSSFKLLHASGQPITVDLLKGYVLSRTKRAGAGVQRDGFRVHTPVATLGTRGATFFAKIEKNGRTFLCVCEGVVKATWKLGERTIKSRHHDNPVWVVAGAKLLPVAPRGFDHNDQDIAALGKLLP